jgi:putative endopeptidase
MHTGCLRQSFVISFVFSAGLAVVACTQQVPVAAPQAAAPGPSSEIPARREFPVNADISPCDNFYQYACSIAVDRFQLRPDRNRHIFTFNDSAERLLTHKTAYLEKLVSQTGLSDRAQQLKDNYVACLNTDARAVEESQLIDLIQETLGRATDRAGVESFLGAAASQSNSGLVQLLSEANMDNPLRYDLIPKPALLTLPDPGMYQNPELAKALQQVYAKFLQLTGAKNVEIRSTAVMALEKQLAEAHLSPTEQRQRETEPRYKSLQEFTQTYPRLLAPLLVAKLPKVLVRDLYPEAFQALNTVLENAELETLKDFIFIRLLAFEMEEIDPTYVSEALAFSSQYLGAAPVRAPVQERCTGFVMTHFEKELDAEILPELFPNFPKEKFVDLVNRVRGAIIARLQKNAWLTDEGKAGAIRKMQTARLQVVRPDTAEEWAFVGTEKFDPSRPVSNKLLRKQAVFEAMVDKLGKDRNPSEWHMGPLVVNAYYNPPDNQFTMPQGILQYPFYDPQSPEAANFGAVGMVVGHELGHGVDDQGSQYDEMGIHRQWMPQQDLNTFQTLTQILVKQFDAVAPASINANYGKLTLGENIADTSGLSFSYDAAFPENQGSLEDKRAFYLQYARVWCGTMRQSEYERRLRVDPHAQTENRVNQPLKHQAGFYEAYSCQGGDNMYLAPQDRMQLW